MPISFGIPSFDAMTDLSAREPQQLRIASSTSIAIIGPDGSGKSIFALHAASKYLADAWNTLRQDDTNDLVPLPAVLYISSDLKFSSALTVWTDFGLDRPYIRSIPFENALYSLERTKHSIQCPDLKVSLTPVTPSSLTVKTTGPTQQTVPQFLSATESIQSADALKVGFLDLATYTAGDDWSYVNKLLGQLAEGTESTPNRLPHLIIIDSVAGFETYVGTLDAFGYEQTRRSRIAQCTRTAGESCSLLFVVEESQTEAHLPEEYTTDAVFRLRRGRAGANHTRTIEIEKARARDHATGEHVFDIRGPKGTSTGFWENADEPQVDNAYIHVFSSLPLRNNRIFRSRGVGKLVPKQSIAPFGVEHLDSLLSAGERPGLEALRSITPPPTVSRVQVDCGGLPTSSLTAMIGDSSTGKSQLAEAFLANNFVPVVELFLSGYFAIKRKQFDHQALLIILQLIAKGTVKDVGGQQSAPFATSQPSSRDEFWRLLSNALQDGTTHTKTSLHQCARGNGLSADFSLRQNALSHKGTTTTEASGLESHQLRSRTDFLKKWESRLEQLVTSKTPSKSCPIADDLELLRFIFEHPNLMWPSILITTSDQTSGLLARRSTVYLSEHIDRVFRNEELSSDLGQVAKIASEQGTVLKELLELLELQFIVRRTDLRDTDSSALLHMIQQNVVQAQELIFGPAFPEHAEDRFPKSQRIRLVIDDFRVLLDTRPSAANDSSLMPFLPFYLDREGITAMFVYTEAIRPNERPQDPLCASLMSLARQSLVLWNVPFAGQKRVAITILPAIHPELNGVVRELKSEEDTRIGKRLDEDDRRGVLAYRLPKVTRYFELFAGIEDGRPVRVPLRVFVYRETHGFEGLFKRTEHLFQAVFGQNVSGASESSNKILHCLGTDDYQILREMTHLPTRMLEDTSIVFQVDGYWSLRPQEVLHDQSDYLQQIIGDRGSQDEDWERDYFALFGDHQAPSEDMQKPYRRIDFFRNKYYTSRLVRFIYGKKRDLKGVPDRVPYMWDFGFLLVHQEAWQLAMNRPIPGQETTSVQHVYQQLTSNRDVLGGNDAISWRVFAGACQEVQREWQRHHGQVLQIFDLALPSLESLNCLFLEIFFSELAAVYGDDEEIKRIAANLSSKTYLGDGFESIVLERLIWNGLNAVGRKHLIEEWRGKMLKESPIDFLGIPKGYLALYRTWLLFLELFPVSPFDIVQSQADSLGKKAVSSVAKRHWYKTACEDQSDRDRQPSDPCTILMRLPGRFSCRGDWFLASSRASRSKLLTERAIDLLCSRRANIERLEQGLGLPVRDIAPDEQCASFQTALRDSSAASERGLNRVDPKKFSSGFLTYGELADKAPQESNDPAKAWLLPLWRTSIVDYDRQARVLERWIDRVLRSTKTYRKHRGNDWDSPFVGYDALAKGQTATISNYDSFVLLAEEADTLVAWLTAARRPPSS